jgi:hypothetical protein
MAITKNHARRSGPCNSKSNNNFEDLYNYQEGKHGRIHILEENKGVPSGTSAPTIGVENLLDAALNPAPQDNPHDNP